MFEGFGYASPGLLNDFKPENLEQDITKKGSQPRLEAFFFRYVFMQTAKMSWRLRNFDQFEIEQKQNQQKNAENDHGKRVNNYQIGFIKSAILPIPRAEAIVLFFWIVF